jgi:hypothetical protein
MGNANSNAAAGAVVFSLSNRAQTIKYNIEVICTYK